MFLKKEVDASPLSIMARYEMTYYVKNQELKLLFQFFFHLSNTGTCKHIIINSHF